MTPLLGTKTPSAPAGDKSGGDRRAARSLLSCALWRGMGRLWRGRHGAPRAAVRAPAAPATGPFGFSRNTRPESRLFCFPVHDCSHCSAKNIVLRQCPRAARSLLSCALWRGMGRLWRGMGGMGRPEPLFAHHPHQQHDHSGFHETRDPAIARRAASASANSEVFTKHETRITAFLFPCSRLFNIVQQKILSCASALVPPGRCFPACCGAAWAAMARHGRHGVPRATVRAPSSPAT